MSVRGDRGGDGRGGGVGVGRAGMCGEEGCVVASLGPCVRRGDGRGDNWAGRGGGAGGGRSRTQVLARCSILLAPAAA